LHLLGQPDTFLAVAARRRYMGFVHDLSVTWATTGCAPALALLAKDGALQEKRVKRCAHDI
jgi:hypothetical protein